MKTCTACSAEKATSAFYRNAARPDGLTTKCKDCQRAAVREYQAGMTPEQKRDVYAKQRDWRQRNPEKVRSMSRSYQLRKYGLTTEAFDALLTSQSERCAICSSSQVDGQPWRVDHDHATGAVRGILCHNCNVGIGHFRDDPSLLARAIDYLGESSGCGQASA